MSFTTNRQLARNLWLGLALLLAMMMVAPSPAVAHKDHDKRQAAAQQVAPPGSPGAATGSSGTSETGSPGHDHMGGMMPGMEMDMDRSNMPFFERLVDWFGRMHPALVHFPIAFFPAALFTALVGRRRPTFAAPVQFLVVTGGILAPIAAIAGWFAGAGADPEPVLDYHRWLGVGVGVVGAALGYWAWRRPWEDRGAGMILALTVMTVAVVIQGFLGASITHGMEHMMF